MEEVLATQELYLRMTFMAERDFNYMHWLLPLQEIAPLVRSLGPGLTKRDLQRELWMVGILGRKMFLTDHEYFGLKGQKYREGRYRISWNYYQKRRPPVQRYMGVGYRDKGNCRDLSWDGRPSMRECSRDEKTRNNWMRAREQLSFGKHYLGLPTQQELWEFKGQREPCSAIRYGQLQRKGIFLTLDLVQT